MTGNEMRARATGSKRRGTSPRVALIAATALGSLACAQTAAAAGTVSGGAFAASANINAVVVPLNVGPLSGVTLPATGGGPFTASLLSTNVLGLATVATGSTSTQGSTGQGTADSSATVANVDILGLVKVTLASSSCSATSGGATGSAKVVDLVVAGLPLAVVDIGPNTKISLPVGTVTINEQTSGPDGITVNAVHVQLNVLGLATGDVILAQSRCGVSSAAHSASVTRAQPHRARHRSASKRSRPTAA